VDRHELMAAPFVRWLRRGFALLLFGAVLEYLVLPQIAGTRKALHLLGEIRPGWVVLGIALEMLSLVSYSMLTRTLLPGPRFFWLLRTDVTAYGLSHLLPGGAATSTAMRYRLLREGGASAEDTAVGMTVEAVATTLVLLVIFLVALLATITLVGFNTLYITTAVVGALFVAGALAAIFGLARQAPLGVRLLRWLLPHLPRRFAPRLEHSLRQASEQLRKLLADRASLRASALYATGNWTLDAASLWVFLAAFGHYINPGELLVGYGLANLLALVPITPGGLGVIEGVLIPSLVGFGTPSAVAVLGVISWRLINFWAPIPVAGGFYLSLRLQRPVR
jgi:uncharacterized protein (TIRG00374 family)